MKLANPLKNKKLLVRTILVILYIGLALLMAVTGKRHTILIDNKDAEDGSYAGVNGMSVQIDKQEASEFYPGDRDKVVVNGARHSISVETFEDKKTTVQRFSISFSAPEMVILSVPKMLAGREPWVEPFSALQEQNSSTTTRSSLPPPRSLRRPTPRRRRRSNVIRQSFVSFRLSGLPGSLFS
ncbi:MAG: hypothetical protein NT061_07230 [Spirochaetes bacterium]|nr:hypothetical protein [Spirochaetota bacterium]